MNIKNSKKGRPARRAGAAVDSEKTKRDILDIATEEFATKGLSGARVDAIAERTRTSKRMIYYHFGSKRGLYSAVLEKAYLGIRNEEAQSNLAKTPPKAALRRLIELTFDYDETHRQFVSLVSIENIHRAEYLAKIPTICRINQSVIRTLDDILGRGQAEGVFRKGIEALDVHVLISAFCFFRVSNQHTLEAIFGSDLYSRKTRKRHRQMIIDAVERLVEAAPRPQVG